MSKNLKLRCIRKLDDLNPPISDPEKIHVLNSYIAVLTVCHKEEIKKISGEKFMAHWTILDRNNDVVCTVMSGKEIKEHFIITGMVSDNGKET